MKLHQRYFVSLNHFLVKVEGKLDLKDVPDQKDGPRFVAIQHLAEEYSLCAATSTGDLLLWNLETLEVNFCHLVFLFSSARRVILLLLGSCLLLFVIRNLQKVRLRSHAIVCRKLGLWTYLTWEIYCVWLVPWCLFLLLLRKVVNMKNATKQLFGTFCIVTFLPWQPVNSTMFWLQPP